VLRRRHALRATPHGDRPTSVADYERTGKTAKDRQIEVWKQQGVDVDAVKANAATNATTKARGYND
jgi:sulfonate dioxygenase